MRRFPNYGLHTHGDVFCVSVVDQEAAPTIFELFPEEPVAPPPPPPPPEVVEPEAPEPDPSMAPALEEEGSEPVQPARKRGRPKKETTDEEE
jgi:hypothetical protein